MLLVPCSSARQFKDTQGTFLSEHFPGISSHGWSVPEVKNWHLYRRTLASRDKETTPNGVVNYVAKRPPGGPVSRLSIMHLLL